MDVLFSPNEFSTTACVRVSVNDCPSFVYLESVTIYSREQMMQHMQFTYAGSLIRWYAASKLHIIAEFEVDGVMETMEYRWVYA